MVLVDKDIIQRNQEIFINGYNQKMFNLFLTIFM